MSAAAAWLRERLTGDDAPLLLDGATGAALHARGVPTPPPLWSAPALIGAPAVVREIARDFVTAGADIVTTNTFRTHARNLQAAGFPLSQSQANRIAVELARDGVDAAGVDRPVCVAGSIAPIADCYRPDLVPGDAACAEAHASHATTLADAGVDCLLIETMNRVREAVAATRAAVATGLPVFTCVVCKPGGVLWSGESVADWVEAVTPLGPMAMGVNCTRLGAMDDALSALAAAAPGVPRIAYANIGAEQPDGNWDSSECPPAFYANHAQSWLDDGARMIGGCCGAGTAHIAALRALIDS